MIAGRPVLVVFAGLPGTGKTTVARALAERTGFALLRIDSIEAALARSTLAIRPAEDAGYEAAYAVAADNLRAGLSVAADAVNAIPLVRDAWRDVAARADALLFAVEIRCSDREEHRRRVETREPDIEGQRLPNWTEVAARAFTPWPEADLRLDTAALAPAAAVERIVAALGGRARQGAGGL